MKEASRSFSAKAELLVTIRKQICHASPPYVVWTSVVGERPFECPVDTCRRRFTQSSSLTTHMRTHSGARPYVCGRCGRAFADSSTLKKHVRVHTGARPYHCDVCPAAFSQSGNLRRHRRIHVPVNSSQP